MSDATKFQKYGDRCLEGSRKIARTECLHFGTSRHFAAVSNYGAFRSEADIASRTRSRLARLRSVFPRMCSGKTGT